MNLGMTEMIFLAVLGLLLFGPKKLPEIGRQIGRALGEFRRASNEFKNQLDDEVRSLELEEESKQTIAPAQPEGTAARPEQPSAPEHTTHGCARPDSCRRISRR
jgi:TatA/E family protein of Tat protein translocase